MTLHAMMTLHVCLESYGAAVHVVDALLGVSAEQVRHVPVRRRAPRRVERIAAGIVSPRDPIFAEQVDAAVEVMPFDLAHVLWLVDVCHCSYDQVAVETALPRDEVPARVTDARRFVRQRIAGPSPAAPIG